MSGPIQNFDVPVSLDTTGALTSSSPGFPDGTTIWVSSSGSFYTLRRVSPPPVGPGVLASLSIPGAVWVQNLIGGTDKTWAAIPYIEPANNAMCVHYV